MFGLGDKDENNMTTLEDTFGKTSTIANIARTYNQSVELAMFVADYYLHGRKVPFYVRPDGDLNRYRYMCTDLQAYCTEFNDKYRGDNYAPNGPPIITPEGYYP